MRTSWVNDARKLYIWSVLDMGKLTGAGQYSNDKYLSSFSEGNLCGYGYNLIETMKHNFLKTGPKISEEKMSLFGKAWTYFLEEVSIRGIDMRRVNRGENLKILKPKSD
ncbi:MAG: hypothetical protein NPIRA06_03530 [Nitrospirales bacterium]|nr:MAG: hypothetical protein NPIRA06_03530 [Nitrospirales bacterium]